MTSPVTSTPATLTATAITSSLLLSDGVAGDNATDAELAADVTTAAGNTLTLQIANVLTLA